MKHALIIGAGPAGLTAAYELLARSGEYDVTVFEESDCFGGISRTVSYKGNRMDMGGHRFFSKIPEVNAWWEKMLPMQGAPALDDRMLARHVDVRKGGPDPETEDRVMLTRGRVSRILFDRKFYDYPISLKPETFRNFGFGTTDRTGQHTRITRVHHVQMRLYKTLTYKRVSRKKVVVAKASRACIFEQWLSLIKSYTGRVVCKQIVEHLPHIGLHKFHILCYLCS